MKPVQERSTCQNLQAGWRPSPSMIVATIALIAEAGTTYAQTAINGADIRNKSIAGQKLKSQSVGTAQLRNLGVESRDIQSGAIRSPSSGPGR